MSPRAGNASFPRGALIGAGVCGCMRAAFKAFAMWFPPRRLPMVNGFLLTFGALGAVSATVPVEWFLGVLDWRALFWGLGAFTLALSLAVYTIVPDHPDPPGHTTLGDQLAGLTRVFRDPFFLGLAPLAGLSMGASLAIIGLWAGPWLRDVAGLARPAVATHMMVITLGMGVGFFTMGIVTERLTRLGLRATTVAGLGMALFLVAVTVMALGAPETGLVALLAATGFLATSGALSYSLLSQHFDRDLAGRANTAQNVIVFVSAFLIQWGIGVVLGYWEDPRTHEYAPTGYAVAFGMAAAIQAVALVWFVVAWARHAEDRPAP